jgi:effector-binding domain-containing protein/uncharacterized membrane protein
MRWLAIVAAVVTGIIAVLYGVGYFLLPVRLEVTRSVQIERPASSVHALLDNLRTFNEWSPWFAADPQAEYVTVGDEGIGQRATWRSRVSTVGRGTHQITQSIENQRIESVIEFADRGSANLLWEITPETAGVNLTWTMSSTCTPSPWRVPCRYINLIARTVIEQDLAMGLERFKVLAEQLPDADFAKLSPEFVRAEPVQFAFVENDVRREDRGHDGDARAEAVKDAVYAQRVATAIEESLAAVRAALEAAGAPPAGPPVIVTVASGRNQLEFQVGYPYSGAGPAADPRVATGRTPSGKAMKVVHVGPAQTLSSTYQLIDAYLRAHRMQAAGGSWEVHTRRDGDPMEQRIEIFVPLY